MRSCYNCPIFKGDKLSVRNCPLTVFDAVNNGFTPGEDCLYRDVKVDGELELTPEQLDNAFKSAQEGMKSCVEWRDPMNKANQAPALAVGGAGNSPFIGEDGIKGTSPSCEICGLGDHAIPIKASQCAGCIARYLDEHVAALKVYEADGEGCSLDTLTRILAEREELKLAAQRMDSPYKAPIYNRIADLLMGHGDGGVFENVKALFAEHEATRWRSRDNAPETIGTEIEAVIPEKDNTVHTLKLGRTAFSWAARWMDKTGTPWRFTYWRPRLQPPSEKEMEGLE